MHFAFDKAQYEKILKNAMLTDRQKKILEYKVRGWYNEDVAAEMQYSERTIRREVKEILRKIDSL